MRPWVWSSTSLLDVDDAQPPGLRDARDLEVGVRGADVRVEPGAAGGHRVRRHVAGCDAVLKGNCGAGLLDRLQ